MKKIILMSALVGGLMLSAQSIASTCYEEPEGWSSSTGAFDRSEMVEDVGSFYNSITPGQTVLQCATFGLASSPTQVWDNTCNCAKAVKDLCDWDPKDGMKASGGATVAACMVFLPLLK